MQCLANCTSTPRKETFALKVVLQIAKPHSPNLHFIQHTIQTIQQYTTCGKAHDPVADKLRITGVFLLLCSQRLEVATIILKMASIIRK